jgi:hypothetical protein
LRHRNTGIFMSSLLETTPTINSAWAKLKFEAEQSTNAPQVRVVGSAFRSNLADEYLYISSAITSGHRLYDLAEELKITPNDLKADKALFNDMVKGPNIKRALLIAEEFQKQTPNGVVISPAIFEAAELGWGQADYMNLWLFEHIIPQTTKMVMTDGWQFSDGAIKEYLTALMIKAGFGERQNIEIVNQEGSALTLDKAYEELTAAMYRLNRVHMPENAQAQALHTISWIKNSLDLGSMNISPPAGFSDVRRFDLKNYQNTHQRAEAFLYEMRGNELLKFIEPAFVTIGGTGRLQYEIPNESIAILELNASCEGLFAESLRKFREARESLSHEA